MKRYAKLLEKQCILIRIVSSLNITFPALFAKKLDILVSELSHFFFQAISDVIDFKFRLYTVPDNMYGVPDSETGEWDGIVRQLIDRRADIAVASMTINYARETVIDFSKPFMNLGISILFRV